MQEIKLQTILSSPIDILKIPHIARKYSTSIQKYQTSFKTKIEAADHDRVFELSKNTSNEMILIENEDGKRNFLSAQVSGKGT